MSDWIENEKAPSQEAIHLKISSPNGIVIIIVAEVK